MAHLGHYLTLGTLFLLGLTHGQGCGGSYEVIPEPTLDYYNKILPAKSIQDILGLTPPRDPKFNILDAVDDLIKKFPKLSSVDRVKEVDAYLEKARESLSPGSDLNLLEIIHDAAATQTAQGEEIASFSAWRQKQDDWFTTGAATEPNIQALKEKLSSASPALKPCWLYLLGAINFRARKLDESEPFFDQILFNYKDAPSAEIALYMKARCNFSRIHSEGAPKVGPEETRKLFTQYLTQYPGGRFAADSWGWLGGVSQDDASALIAFAHQAEATNHPEVFASAVTEIEKILDNISYTDGDLGFDKISQHPEIALALTYVLINTSSTHRERVSMYDIPSPEDQAKLVRWRATTLPKLASAVVDHKNLYKGARDENRYLTILAHAASDNGDQQKALELVSMVNLHQPSDDFLFVKALVLQRSGKLTDAAKTYRELLQDFPNSALVPGTRYRLSLALHDQKQEGEALLELAKLTDNKIPLTYPASENDQITPSSPYLFRPKDRYYFNENYDYNGAQKSQIKQTFETILNFAAIESLASPLNNTDSEHEIFRIQLREIIVARCLANNDFESASGFIEDPLLKKEFSDKAKIARALMSASQNSSRHTVAVNSNPSRDVLAANAKLMAEYWTEHRFKLTWIPLQASVLKTDYNQNNSDEFRRYNNGLLLHYSKEDITKILGSLDEISHALFWWQKVKTFDPQGPFAPQAVWKIIEGNRLMAQETAFSLQRAHDTNLALKIKESYHELQNDFPKSFESKNYAAYWNFPQLSEMEAYQSQLCLRRYYDDPLDSKRFHRTGWFDALQIPFEDDSSAKASEWGKVCQEIAQLPTSTARDTDQQFAQRINHLRKISKPLALINNRASEINCLDDLVDLSTVPHLDPLIRTEYIKLRINATLEEHRFKDPYHFYVYNSQDGKLKLFLDLKNDPRSQPIADFLDALDIRDLAGPPKLSPDDFLIKYPNSIKRELAFYYRIRYLLRDSSLPIQNIDAITAAFKDYDKEFPEGKLRRGVIFMRATFNVNQRDWKGAIHNFSLILSQDESPELKQDSAHQLALIFDQLNDDALRHDILQAILEDKVARPLLKKYANCGQLPFLKDYVLEKLSTL